MTKVILWSAREAVRSQSQLTCPSDDGEENSDDDENVRQMVESKALIRNVLASAQRQLDAVARDTFGGR